MRKGYQKQFHRKTKKRVRRRSASPAKAVQLTLDRSEVLREMQEGLHRFGVTIGLELAALMMRDEVERLCGSRYEHRPQREATRHGQQRGVITIAGQKIGIERPRVRSTRDKREVPLEVYGLVQREEAMPAAVLARMVRGVSCRDYEGVIESAAEGFGVKRSSVSRAFSTASAQKITELRERRLDDTRFPVVFIDGIGWAETTMVVALGISEDGSKRVLGFREGATENGEVCKALLEDLVERGLDTSEATLFVIDGGKALRKAITKVWGTRALVQRCRVHKKRNIEAHVPDRLWPDVARMLDKAWAESDYERARKQLVTLAAYLDRIAPDAAGSLREGMEETLTVTRLRIDPALAIHLVTTNPIESSFSCVRKLTQRVKRWRDGLMKHRWCATGLLDAERRFRRIKGFSSMHQLIKTLDAPLVDTPVVLEKKIA
jgi:transposase-like protein